VQTFQILPPLIPYWDSPPSVVGGNTSTPKSTGRFVKFKDKQSETLLPPERGSKPMALRKMVRKSTLDYESSDGSKDYREPEWDFNYISQLATLESYFLRSIRLKTALALKEGYDTVGTLQDAVDYLKMRYRQLAYAMGEPWEQLIARTFADLVQHSNALWVKTRLYEIKGRKRITGTRTDTHEDGPVIAYHYLPIESIVFKKNKQGQITFYKQIVIDPVTGRERTKIFPAHKVVHFTYDKKGGFSFGFPQVVPAIDDILTLRVLEQNVATMVHRFLFPLFHYMVGTDKQPADKDPRTGQDEVVRVQEEVASMPTQGAFVTDHRHVIKVLGAENKALRAESYLDFFKKRAFSGLSISGLDVGETETANRATSEAVSKLLIDTVKDYQTVFANQFNMYILEPLLDESLLSHKHNFLLEKNCPRFTFPEIDKDAQIKKETHALQLLLSSAITYTEFRQLTGKDPYTTAEWEDTYFALVQRELIREEGAVQLSMQQASNAGQTGAKAQGKNTITPSNQHSPKSSSKLSSKALKNSLMNSINWSKLTCDTQQLSANIFIYLTTNGMFDNTKGPNVLLEKSFSVAKTIQDSFASLKLQESIDPAQYQAVIANELQKLNKL